jgi:hypothetical protein
VVGPREGRPALFEKKQQITFGWLSRTRRQRVARGKVFWFFFSKKNCFLAFLGVVVSLALVLPTRISGQAATRAVHRRHQGCVRQAAAPREFRPSAICKPRARN